MQRPTPFPLSTSPDRVPKSKRLAPRDVIVRAATAELLRLKAGNRIEDNAALVERVYAGCEATRHYLHIVSRAAVSPAMTGTAGWAAELVETAAQDFLADLATQGTSAFAQLAQRALAVTLGRAGSVKIAARAHPWAPVGGWIAEGAPIPVAQVGLNGVTLSPFKLAGISTFSEEIRQWSVPPIEAVVSEALRYDLGALLDQSLLDATAASAVRPAGLLNGATAVTASTATPLSEAAIADLQALYAAASANNPTARIAFIANPAQVLRIQAAVGAGNVIASGFVTAGTVGAIDVTALAMLIEAPRFASSENATLNLDTSPAAIGTPGSPPVVAAPTQSMYQIDAVALRSIVPGAWKLRRTGAVAKVTGVAW